MMTAFSVVDWGHGSGSRKRIDPLHPSTRLHGRDGMNGTAEVSERSPGGRGKSRREVLFSAFWLTAAAPVAISLLSLALSIYTIIEANREPEVWLSAPDIVRIASGERAWFYVQPRLVSAARNDRMSIISELELEVITQDEESPVTFTWDEQGTWQYDPESRGLTWIFVADAAPLVVGPSSPQLPYCLFEGPEDWRWRAGRYQVTIVATRAQDAGVVRATFAMEVPAETAEFINAQPRTWIEVRTQGVSPPG